MALTVFAGCVTSGSDHVLSRTLPPTPAWAKEVHVSEPRPDEFTEERAAVERKGRLEANRIITALVGWIEQRRKSLAGERR